MLEVEPDVFFVVRFEIVEGIGEGLRVGANCHPLLLDQARTPAEHVAMRLPMGCVVAGDAYLAAINTASLDERRCPAATDSPAETPRRRGFGEIRNLGNGLQTQVPEVMRVRSFGVRGGRGNPSGIRRPSRSRRRCGAARAPSTRQILARAGGDRGPAEASLLIGPLPGEVA